MVAVTVALLFLITGVLVFVFTRPRHRPPSSDADVARAYGFAREEAGLLGGLPGEDRLHVTGMERDPNKAASAESTSESGATKRRNRYVYPMLVETDDEVRGLHEFKPNETLEQQISRAIVENHREEPIYDSITDSVEVARLCAEGRDLMYILNRRFSTHGFDAKVADRLFHTDVAEVLRKAQQTVRIDFRVYRMIAVMRRISRTAPIGRGDLAKAMAVRMLLGTAQLTEDELEQLQLNRRILGDEYPEAAGYADHLSRIQQHLERQSVSKQIDLGSPLELEPKPFRVHLP